MEKDRSIFLNGQELNIADWNAVCGLASLTQDYLIQEMFRPYPVAHGSGVPRARGIIPYGTFGSNGADPQNAGVVKGTGSPSPTLLVYPFRAMLGSPSGPPDVTGIDSWRGGRTVNCANPNTDSLATPVTIAHTASNHRCDLVVCKVSLETANITETRYFRDPSDGAVSQAITNVETGDEFTIEVVQGTESATPVPPGTPIDGGSNYYIPLAYIWIAHPFFGVISSAENIQEIAPVIPISRATGAGSTMPGNQQYNPTGALMSAHQFGPTTGRPDVYVPSTMVGQESRFFAFQWDGATKVPAVNTTDVIDDSVDWRNRAFEWHAMAVKNTGASKFAWAQLASGSTTNTPSAFNGGLGANRAMGMGQSFVADLSGFSLPTGAAVCVVGASLISQMSNTATIFVDTTDGRLYLNTTADPGVNLFVWLKATGPFANHG